MIEDLDRMRMSWALPTQEAEGIGPDHSALLAAAKGDEAALRWLYERHGPSLLSFLRGQLRDPGLAEEVLQDVMLAAWRSASSFRGDCQLRTWLFAIAHRRALNARRRKRLPSEPIDETRPARLPDAPPADRGSALRMDLRDALNAISADHRACLDLFFFHELSIAEIAQVLDLPPGTVKSRLHRAKGQLRRVLARSEKDASDV